MQLNDKVSPDLIPGMKWWWYVFGEQQTQYRFKLPEANGKHVLIANNCERSIKFSK